MKKVIFFIAFLTALGCKAQSTTTYATIYNQFAQLNHDPQAAISGKYLQLENSMTNEVIVLDTTQIDSSSSYKYYLHFANLNNKEGKTYKAIDECEKSHSFSSTMCGIVFNYSPTSHFVITAHCNNSSLFNESVDERTMTITLSKVVNGCTQEIKSKTISQQVDLSTGFNYLGVNVEESNITVMAGENELNPLFSLPILNSNESGVKVVKVGYFVGPAAKISIERAVLSVSQHVKDPVELLATQWNREALDRHFAQSKNPFEGYWTYLDRDMEDTWLKLGGRYTIALVENSQGYDIIYVDGAQVKKSLWHTGMKKGEMRNTIFTDNFNASWIDATLEPINQDVYATFESGVILNIKFPVYKSQVRFSKVLDQQHE